MDNHYRFYNPFLVNILFVCDLIQVRLYAVAEESRENIECPDQEQARADKRHYRLGDAVLARVHLDVDLERGNDGENRSDGIARRWTEACTSMPARVGYDRKKPPRQCVWLY